LTLVQFVYFKISFGLCLFTRRGDMKRIGIFLCLLVCVTIFSLSCGGGGGESTANPPEVNITGTWHGTFTNGAQSFGVTFTIIQNGAEVSGTYSATSGGSGTIQGTFSGSSLSFTLIQTNYCPGSYNGQGTVNGNVMTFSGSGSDCTGTYNGSGTAMKS